MSMNFVNKVYLEGYLYDNDLEEKVVENKESKNFGVKYYRGSISVATDDEMLNVIKVYYTYVAPMTGKGKKNFTYEVIEDIFNGNIRSVMQYGKDKADKISISGASINLNEYPDRRNEGAMVCQKRAEGGFVNWIHRDLLPENQRNVFEVDMLINGTTHIDENEERGTKEHVNIKGAVFGYGKKLLPIDFNVYIPAAMDYFEGLESSPSNPILTRVKGQQISQTVTREITEECAFGDASVRTVTNSYKDFVITWARSQTYDWDSEETLLASELKEMISNRELHLAELKQNYEANKQKESPSAFATPAASNKEYDF